MKYWKVCVLVISLLALNSCKTPQEEEEAISETQNLLSEKFKVKLEPFTFFVRSKKIKLTKGGVKIICKSNTMRGEDKYTYSKLYDLKIMPAPNGADDIFHINLRRRIKFNRRVPSYQNPKYCVAEISFEGKDDNNNYQGARCIACQSDEGFSDYRPIDLNHRDNGTTVIVEKLQGISLEPSVVGDHHTINFIPGDQTVLPSARFCMP